LDYLQKVIASLILTAKQPLNEPNLDEQIKRLSGHHSPSLKVPTHDEKEKNPTKLC